MSAKSFDESDQRAFDKSEQLAFYEAHSQGAFRGGAAYSQSAGAISTDDIAKEILKVLRKHGIPAKSFTEARIMADIMVLIAHRDDRVVNYAYKMGRASA